MPTCLFEGRLANALPQEVFDLQVSRTEELQSHLKRALEGNANLSRLYSQLDERLGRAYITIAGKFSSLCNLKH